MPWPDGCAYEVEFEISKMNIVDGRRLRGGCNECLRAYRSGSERLTWGVLGQFSSQLCEHQARFIMGRNALSDNGVLRLKNGLPLTGVSICTVLIQYMRGFCLCG